MVVVYVLFLLATWLLFWGSLSVANVLSGLAVSALVLVILPETLAGGGRPRGNPLEMVKLTVRIVSDLVKANVTVARQILSRSSTTRSGIVEIPLPLCSDAVVTFVASVVSLSPGILPVEVMRDPGRIFVHVLRLDDVDKVRREIQSLAAQAVRAFGSAEAIAAIDALDGRTSAASARRPAGPDDLGGRP